MKVWFSYGIDQPTAFRVTLTSGLGGLPATQTYLTVVLPAGAGILTTPVLSAAAWAGTPITFTDIDLIALEALPVAGGDVQIDNLYIPEPSTYALLAGLGLVGFAGYRRFRG